MITVNIRLFAGLDKDVDVESYDRHRGIRLNVPDGTRLKKVVKMTGGFIGKYAVVDLTKGISEVVEPGENLGAFFSKFYRETVTPTRSQ